MDLTAILKKGVDDWLAADESRTFEELARLSRMTPEELRGVIVGKWTLTNDLVYLYNIIFPSEIIREIISKYHKNLAWSLKKENGKEIFLAPASEKEESISSQDISIYHYCSAKNKTAKKVIEKLWGRSGTKSITRLVELGLLEWDGEIVVAVHKNLSFFDYEEVYRHMVAMLDESRGHKTDANFGVSLVSEQSYAKICELRRNYVSEVVELISEKPGADENGTVVYWQTIVGHFEDSVDGSKKPESKNFSGGTNSHEPLIDAKVLAHDVRRPLSMVQSLMDLMLNAEDPQELLDIATRGASDVSQAMTSVDDKIKSILAPDNESILKIKRTSPSQLIFETLTEIFSYRDCPPQRFEYNFNHEYAVDIDVAKIKRVLTNIIVNALEAISGSQNFWFHTSSKAGRCEIVIGNSGSHIPADRIPRLFETNYTEGKAHGNGLGLAICKNFVELHGGTISCRSDKATGVEFVITLPVDPRLDDARGRLMTMPQSSTELSRHAEIRFARQSQDDGELFYLKQLNKFENESLDVVIFDDDLTYINALTGIFKKYPYIYKRLNISSYTDPTTVLQHKPDAFILDYDFGEDTTTEGLTLGADLRKAGHHGLICMHSNILNLTGAKMPDHVAMSTAKPMTSAQCLEFLCKAFEARRQRLAKDAMPAKFRRVLLIEDDAIFHRRWQKLLGKDRVLWVSSQQAAEELSAAQLEEIDLVIADFELGTAATGLDVCRYLQDERSIAAPMYLYTNHDDLSISEPIVGILPKDIEQAWQILNS